jgi:hypothetical protein
MPLVGDVFLKLSTGTVFSNIYTPPVAGCTPVLSGFAINTDFQMGLCDVTVLSDVTAMSSGQVGDLGNSYPTYVSGKRLSDIRFVALVDDATAANGTRLLQLTSTGTEASDGTTDTWENITVPFPYHDYHDVWCRAVIRHLTEFDNAGFLSANQGNGLQFYRNARLGGYYASDYTASGNDFGGGAITPRIPSSEAVELIWHYIAQSETPQPPPNAAQVTLPTLLACYVRRRSTGDVYRVTQVATGDINIYHVNDDPAQALSGLILSFPTQFYGSGELEVHGWEFVDGTAHSDPFGVVGADTGVQAASGIGGPSLKTVVFGDYSTSSLMLAAFKDESTGWVQQQNMALYTLDSTKTENSKPSLYAAFPSSTYPSGGDVEFVLHDLCNRVWTRWRFAMDASAFTGLTGIQYFYIGSIYNVANDNLQIRLQVDMTTGDVNFYATGRGFTWTSATAMTTLTALRAGAFHELAVLFECLSTTQIRLRGFWDATLAEDETKTNAGGTLPMPAQNISVDFGPVPFSTSAAVSIWMSEFSIADAVLNVDPWSYGVALTP